MVTTVKVCCAYPFQSFSYLIILFDQVDVVYLITLAGYLIATDSYLICRSKLSQPDQV